jgi:hypothetical protein
MSMRKDAPGWKIKRPMTATMAATLADIIDKGGKLVRRQGGYWTEPGAAHRGIIGHPYDWWASTPTIEGLVRRGELEYADWRDGSKGRFPIEVRIAGCDCQAPKVESGAALVSERCPIHGKLNSTTPH